MKATIERPVAPATVTLTMTESDAEALLLLGDYSSTVASLLGESRERARPYQSRVTSTLQSVFQSLQEAGVKRLTQQR